MKITYEERGFELEAEDGRDSLFLASFLKDISPEYRPILSNFIRVDMEEMYVKTTDRNGEELPGGETAPMEDCGIEEVFEKKPRSSDNPWGEIKKISFGGSVYSDDEMIEKTETLLEVLKKY